MGQGLIDIQEFSSRFSLPQKEKIPSSVKKKKIIVIAGPTGVGKTAASLRIAKAIGGEIVSGDSVQVYRGMDIGTAKASKAELAEVSHHLIDIRDLNESFNVMDFYIEAQKAIQQILSRGRVPIIVGGTGFYIHALIYGPPSGPPSVAELRAQLEGEMESLGAEALYERLKKLDPDYATTITQRDRHKIIRALEIITLTHQKVSQFAKESKVGADEYDFRTWFLYMEKETLYPRLEMRCDEMVARGFLDEVRGLEKEGLRSNLSACQAIGYRQCLDYLASPQTQDDWDRFMVAFKQASRRYAKRQFTWFRKEPLFRWLDVEKVGFEAVVETIIQDYELSF